MKKHSIKLILTLPVGTIGGMRPENCIKEINNKKYDTFFITRSRNLR